MSVPAADMPVQLNVSYATYVVTIAALRQAEATAPGPILAYRAARHDLHRAMLEAVSREQSKLRNEQSDNPTGLSA